MAAVVRAMTVVAWAMAAVVRAMTVVARALAAVVRALVAARTGAIWRISQ